MQAREANKLQDISAAVAQARVGLKCIDHLDEIIEAQNPLKLEACLVIGSPDKVGLDPPDYWQTYNQPLSSAQVISTLCHEAVG